MTVDARPTRPGHDSESLHSLVHRIADGDVDAFAALYDLLAPALLRLVAARCDSAPEGDELMERICLHLWRAAPGFPRDRIDPAEWIGTTIDQALARSRPASLGR